MSKFKSLLALAVLAVSAFAITGCSQIDSGNVGVVKTFGKINPEELPQGTHLTWLATVDEFTSKEVSLSFDNMKPKAKDNLTIADLDVDIYYQANPTQIAETVVKYQGDVVKHKQVVKDGTSDLIAGYNRVSRAAREAIYQAVAEFPATTMHTKRSELSDRIQKILQKELDTNDKGAWTVTGVNVRGLVTDPAIESSIRAAAETDQAIARANKEKELAVVEAGKAREVAKGQADANSILAASLTPQLIRLKEIEAQKAFAGAGTHTVLMGQGGGSYITMGK